MGAGVGQAGEAVQEAAEPGAGLAEDGQRHLRREGGVGSGDLDEGAGRGGARVPDRLAARRALGVREHGAHARQDGLVEDLAQLTLDHVHAGGAGDHVPEVVAAGAQVRFDDAGAGGREEDLGVGGAELHLEGVKDRRDVVFDRGPLLRLQGGRHDVYQLDRGDGIGELAGDGQDDV
ncbi:hypothetical protein [Streptomyces globosus]|uniref:hypothetical protein n=1 Tax=Streptomyces globosus TaxID=68209 RepID=UPI0038135C97